MNNGCSILRLGASRGICEPLLTCSSFYEACLGPIAVLRFSCMANKFTKKVTSLVGLRAQGSSQELIVLMLCIPYLFLLQD